MALSVVNSANGTFPAINANPVFGVTAATNGNIMVVFIRDNNTALSSHSGWTQLDTLAGVSNYISCYRIASSESGTIGAVTGATIGDEIDYAYWEISGQSASPIDVHTLVEGASVNPPTVTATIV